jgi:hypothetical protein
MGRFWGPVIVRIGFMVVSGVNAVDREYSRCDMMAMTSLSRHQVFMIPRNQFLQRSVVYKQSMLLVGVLGLRAGVEAISTLQLRWDPMMKGC